MGNKSSNRTLYNEKNKVVYLEDSNLKPNTKISDRTCLLKIADQEKLLQKDLYEFDEKEVIDFFTSGFTNSSSVAKHYHSVFKRYVRWSITKGFKKINVNPFDKLKLTRDIWPKMKRLEVENFYIPEDKLWQIAREGKNAQDIICMIPVFYGIRGIKCSELINLKKGDIDSVKNTVTLFTKETTKIMHLPQKIIETFKKSSEQEIYNRRGKPGYGERITAKLMESEYVIRTSEINRMDQSFHKQTKR